jgi:hypothetical protein
MIHLNVESGLTWVGKEGGRRVLVNRPQSRGSPLGENSSWEERKPAGAPRRTVFWPEKNARHSDTQSTLLLNRANLLWFVWENDNHAKGKALGVHGVRKTKNKLVLLVSLVSL